MNFDRFHSIAILVIPQKKSRSLPSYFELRTDRDSFPSPSLSSPFRKHTGERPFVCHCGKAFSRLDNLRQHANTVHVDAPEENEKTISALSALHAQLAANAAAQQHAHIQTLPRHEADALVQASAEQNGRKKKAPSSKKAKEDKKGGDIADQRKHSGSTSLGDPSSSRRTSNQNSNEDSYPYSNGMGGPEDSYASPYSTHPSANWHGPPGGESYYSTPREHGSGSGSGSGSGGVHSFRNSYDSNNGGASMSSYFHPQDPHSQHQGSGSYYAYDHQPHHHQNLQPPPPLQNHPHHSQYGQPSYENPHHSSQQPHPDHYPSTYDHYSGSSNNEGPNHHFNHPQQHPQQAFASRYGNPNDPAQNGREDGMDFPDSYYPQNHQQYATPGSGSGASSAGSFSAGHQQPPSSYQSTLSAHLHMRTPTMSRQSLPPKESPPPPSSMLAGSPDLPLAAAHDRPILPPLTSLSRPGTAGGLGVANSGGSFSLLGAVGSEDRRPSIGLGSLGLGAIGRGSIDLGRGSIDAGSFSNQGSSGGPSLPSIGVHLSAAEGADDKPFSSPESRTGPGLAPISSDVASSGQDSSSSSLPESLRNNSISSSGGRLRSSLLQEPLANGSSSRPNTTGGSKPGSSSILASMASTINERLQSRPTSSSRLTSLANFGGSNEDMKAPPISSIRSGSANDAQSEIKISPPMNSSPFMFQPPPLPGLNNSSSDKVNWNTASPFGSNRPSSSKLNGGGFLTSRRRGSEDLSKRIDGKEKPILAVRPGSSSGTGTPKVEDENKEFFRSRPFTSGGESNSGIKPEQQEEEDDDFFPPPPSGAGLNGLDSRRVSIASLMNDDSSSNQLYRSDLFSSGSGSGSRLSFGGGEIFSSKWWSSSNGLTGSGSSRPGTSSRDLFSSNQDSIKRNLDEMAEDFLKSRRNSSAPPVATPGEERNQEFGDIQTKNKSGSVPLEGGEDEVVKKET